MFGIISILGILATWVGGHLTDVRLESLKEKLEMAETHSADRLITAENSRQFAGILRNGMTLHLFFLTGDHEAERFADSIKRAIRSVIGAQGEIVVSSTDEYHMNSGLLPGGIFGPFGGDPNDMALQGASNKLMIAFEMLDFCIYPQEVTPSMRVLDPSPSAISLIIGPKNKSDAYCK
jgi:hypothetical protein